MRTEHKLAAVLAVGTAAVCAVVANVASATTGPAPHALVNVVVTDNTIKLSRKQVQDVTFVDFYVHNTGRLNHDMVVGGQKSAVVRPGERVHFYVGFPVFGWYPYHVSLNGKPQMKGRFHINAPQPPD
jgi:hypothetical protein